MGECYQEYRHDLVLLCMNKQTVSTVWMTFMQDQNSLGLAAMIFRKGITELLLILLASLEICQCG